MHVPSLRSNQCPLLVRILGQHVVKISDPRLTDAQRNTRRRRGVSSRKKRGLETCILEAATGLRCLRVVKFGWIAMSRQRE
jgi:hypothetical protein